MKKDTLLNYKWLILITLTIIGLVGTTCFLWINNDGKKQTGVVEMKTEIYNYMLHEMKIDQSEADEYYEILSRHEDLLQEFYQWLKTRKFLDEKSGGIVVKEYIAQRVHDEAVNGIAPIDVYVFLVNLRETDEPEEWLKVLHSKICLYGIYRSGMADEIIKENERKEYLAWVIRIGIVVILLAVLGLFLLKKYNIINVNMKWMQRYFQDSGRDQK